jgi:oligopeptide transport system substrate-binding protein
MSGKFSFMFLSLAIHAVHLVAITNSYGAESESSRRILIRVAGNNLKPFEQETTGFAQITFYNAVLGKLISISPDHQISPNLLKEAYWDYARGGYVLTLPDGLHFHNGRLATAEDLDFSIARFFLTTGRSDPVVFLNDIEGIEVLKRGQPYKSWQVSGIRKINDRSVFIKLEQRDPSFLLALSVGWLSLVPQEELKSDYITWRRLPVGAGPYRVIYADPKSSLVTIEQANCVSKTTPMTIDFTSDPNDERVDLVAFTPTNPLPNSLKKVYGEGPFGFSGVLFNFKSRLAQNIHFRRALALSIQRARLLDDWDDYTVLTELLTSNFIGRLHLPEEFDLAEARREIKKVPKALLAKPVRAFGYAARIQTKFDASVLGRLAETWKSIGVQVDFVPADNLRFAEKDVSTVFRIDERGTAFVDPLPIFRAFYRRGFLARFFPSDDPKYGKMLAVASQARDINEKANSIAALSRYVLDNCYLIPLFEKKIFFWSNPKRIMSLGTQRTIGLDVTQIALKVPKENKEEAE